MEFLPVEWSVQKSALRKKIPQVTYLDCIEYKDKGKLDVIYDMADIAVDMHLEAQI